MYTVTQTQKGESENTWTAYLHFLQHYRGRQVSSEWNKNFSQDYQQEDIPLAEKEQ